MSGFRRPLFELDLNGRKLVLGRETKIMGVLNVTLDSFSDGGLYLDSGRAEAQALKMEREGAALIDVGGETSKPGSKPIPASREIARIVPVLKRLAGKVKIPVSVDTYKYEVVCAALDAGAALINDIYALSRDPRIAKRIARAKAGVVLMHMQGHPGNMQKNPVYRNVAREVRSSLKKSVEAALQSGIARNRIVVDPGFGFGKTTQHNLEILRELKEIARLKLPVLVGLSRKSFIGNVLAAPTEDRLLGSVAAAVLAIANGAHILRVHDVAAHAQAAAIADRTLWN